MINNILYGKPGKRRGNNLVIAKQAFFRKIYLLNQMGYKYNPKI